MDLQIFLAAGWRHPLLRDCYCANITCRLLVFDCSGAKASAHIVCDTALSQVAAWYASRTNASTVCVTQKIGIMPTLLCPEQLFSKISVLMLTNVGIFGQPVDLILVLISEAEGGVLVLTL